MDLFCFQLWLSNKNMYGYENSLQVSEKSIFNIFFRFLLKIAFKRLPYFFNTFVRSELSKKKEAYSHCFYGPEECCVLAEEVSRRRVVFDLRSLPVQTVGQCKDWWMISFFKMQAVLCRRNYKFRDYVRIEYGAL